MITVDISDWAAVATILGVGITVLVVLTRKIDTVEARLGARIDKVDAKIDKTREESRAEVADLRNDFRFLSQTIVDFLAHPPQHTTRSRGE